MTPGLLGESSWEAIKTTRRLLYYPACSGRSIGRPSAGKKSLETLKTAEKLVLHYLHHGMRCYDSVESLEISDARKILEAIYNGKLKPKFKTADIYRNELKGMDRPWAANALQLLQDYNCVALQRDCEKI